MNEKKIRISRGKGRDKGLYKIPCASSTPHIMAAWRFHRMFFQQLKPGETGAFVMVRTDNQKGSTRPEDAKEIVASWLRENGYDGLYSPMGECACEVGDLAPCCEDLSGCKPGYKGPCDPNTCEIDGRCDWHICPDKPEPKKRKSQKRGKVK